MMNCETLVGKIIKLKNVDGDRLTARLVEIVDQKFLKLRFRSGMEAFIAINDIVFIAPICHQPQASEVV